MCSKKENNNTGITMPKDKTETLLLDKKFKSISVAFTGKNGEIKNYVLRRTIKDRLILT